MSRGKCRKFKFYFSQNQEEIIDRIISVPSWNTLQVPVEYY